MGDRTSAGLIIREEYYSLIKDLIDEPTEINFFCGTVELEWWEVNYGDLSEETEILHQLKIPYDYWHGDGGDYDAQRAHLRWDAEGKSHVVSYNERLHGMCSINEALCVVREGGDIEQWLQNRQEEFMPWNNQTDLAEIPLRELTPEESAKIMEYKMNKEK